MPAQNRRCLGEGLAARARPVHHVPVPTVTQDTAARPAKLPIDADPVSRVRRLLGSVREHHAADLRDLDLALTRFDAPVDLRVRGGLGSGRRTLAEALRSRRGWRPAVDDLDSVADPDRPCGTPPDVEIVCLRTAPCRHEEEWVRRPRSHALLVVATGVDVDAPPRWARGLTPVDARHPTDSSLDPVIDFLERALAGLAGVRLARLEAELDQLAVRPEIGELADAALCALGQGRS